jgi:hypothetical protein
VLVLVGLGAAVLLATGYVLQQHEAAEQQAAGWSPGLLLVLARRPIWLTGIAAMVCGQILGAVALGLGSLVVVEPLLATNVLFALPLAALASRRRLSRGDWVGALMLVGGLGLFLLGGARTTPDAAAGEPGPRRGACSAPSSSCCSSSPAAAAPASRPRCWPLPPGSGSACRTSSPSAPSSSSSTGCRRCSRPGCRGAGSRWRW